MPAFSVNNYYPVVKITFFLYFSRSLGKYFLFNTLTLAVVVINFVRNSESVEHIIAEQKLNRSCGAAHSSGGIDARSNSESNSACRNILALNSRHAHKRRKACQRRLLQLFNTVFYNSAVLVYKRHNVSRKRHTQQIRIIRQKLLRLALFQNTNQLESDFGAAYFLKFRAAVRPVRVNNGIGLGQSFFRKVMVCNHDRHTELLCPFYFIMAGNTVIHRYKQLYSFSGKFLDSASIHAVSLIKTVGNIIYAVSSPAFEIAEHQNGRGNTVAVIIAVYRNSASVFNI